MLVLSRRENEQLIIGDNITITICRIRNGVVKIGIEAPRDMPIVRAELRDEEADSDVE